MLKHLKTFRAIVENASKQSVTENVSKQSVVKQQSVNLPTLVTEKLSLITLINGQFLINHFQQCKSFKCLTQLHSLTIKIGFSGNSFYSSKLIQLYSKFASIQTVRKVFDETSQRRTSTWNLVSNIYYKEKQYQELLVLFSHLFSLQKVNGHSISIALKACCALQELHFGKIIQGFVVKSAGLSQDLFIGSALVELYSKCGRMESALCVFEEYAEPDAVLWHTVVCGYVQNGEDRQAVEFFSRTVIGKCIVIDALSLISVVSACTRVLDVKVGKSVHGYMIKSGFNRELPLLNAVLSFYGKMGCVNAAGKLFTKMEAKDAITWGCIVSCYANHGKAGEALDLFDKMVSKGIETNVVVILSALQACIAIRNLETGKRIHKFATSKGIDSNIMISTALINMYMNCCSPEEAINVFESIPVKDDMCYTSLLCGCIHNGLFHKSFEVLRNMLVINIRPSSFHMVNILTACSELDVLRQTSCIHCFIVKVGLDKNSYIGVSLIKSYAKCGSLDDSIAVFDGIRDIGVVIWNSMLAGYGFHGKGHDALELFNEMINSSVRPNDASFVSILSACSQAGLVQEGIDIFNKMVNDYKQVPHLKHYGIVFDLLGRVGELDKAMDFINRMPGPVGTHIWEALLGACRVYQNKAVGEVATKKLIELDPGQTGHHILLSNLYAVDESWDTTAETRKLVKEMQIKEVGQSVIELTDEACSPTANDNLCDRSTHYSTHLFLESS